MNRIFFFMICVYLPFVWVVSSFSALPRPSPTRPTLQRIIPQLLLRCGSGSFFDELGRFLRMRNVGRMARIHLDCLGISALGHLALVFRIDRSVPAPGRQLSKRRLAAEKRPPA